jgi:hypothetical protein
MDSRWNKNLVSLGSPVTSLMRFPNSPRISAAEELKATSVSRATEWNMKPAGRSKYFSVFRVAAPSAADPAISEVGAM